MWESFLKNNKVKKIESLQKKINLVFHEAIGEINDAEQEDQIIVEEKEVGYLLEEKVIRPAKVIINNKERK